MTSTYDFYSCQQKPDQSFAQWKAELCEKLRYCCFTTSILKNKPQHRALRNMYVIGVKNSKIRQLLLKKKGLDLEKAEKIIQVVEKLEQDFGPTSNSVEAPIAKIDQKKLPVKPALSPNKT